ncbi:Sapep family Mn(2+)-dependent dipeptidase [Mollicutes bacterium LVI A0039]|nr:Sapep family Mn(2+)-dependent dipeptidase [Mollicutes bacterium LVI A0039]
MRKNIKLKAHEQVNETITKIQEIVRIDSVRDTDNAAPGAPFGQGIRDSLDMFLNMASEIGLRTYADPEGRYGYAEIGPENTEMIGILGHVDVVPVGELSQWTKGLPFAADIVDDAIIGRGTLDDKGPMVMNLMAVKTLLECGVEFNKRVRFIVGCAEETTWECMNAYTELEEMPTTGFTPDANFPVIHAEKTIVRFDGVKKNVNNNFTLIAEGAYNSVNDKATYTGSKIAEVVSELEKLDATFEQTEISVTVKGKSAHAMATHLGVNAIYILATAMYNAGERSKSVDFIAEKMADTFYGEKICGEVHDEVSGKLTLNIGWVKITETEEAIGFDSRIPVLVDAKQIIETYKKAIENYGIEYIGFKETEALYEPADGPLVSTLLNVYREVTGDHDTKPLTTGGGTYARAAKGTVAFGCVFGSFDMIDNMHQPNECLELRFIPMALEIYALAIYDLLNN